jgi:hypothetical protein
MLNEEQKAEKWDEESLRLEEIITHPNDLAFNCLDQRKRATQKQLSQERSRLNHLLKSLPLSLPKQGTKERESYKNIEMQIEIIKKQISMEHNELMEILKNEEKQTKKNN